MRAISDVKSLRPLLIGGNKLAIAGGGYIGLEVAAAAVKLGLDAEIVEFAPGVLARVGGANFPRFTRLHTARRG